MGKGNEVLSNYRTSQNFMKKKHTKNVSLAI